MFEAIRDLLFPAQCANCEAHGAGLCDACFPRGAPPLTVTLPTLRVRALGPYEGALRRAVLALKDGRRDVAAALGERVSGLLFDGTPVVPVPTSAVRRRMRGFDGGVLLARIAGNAANVPVLEALRLRTRDSQRGRDRAHRLAAGGRFQCEAHVLDGATVVLLDDVTTTGATLEDCAAALRAAGAIVHEAVTVAARTLSG